MRGTRNPWAWALIDLACVVVGLVLGRRLYRAEGVTPLLIVSLVMTLACLAMAGYQAWRAYHHGEA